MTMGVKVLPKRGDPNLSALILLTSLVLSLNLLPVCSRYNTVPQLVVFAAAGGRPAIDEICHKFKEQHRIKVETSYGGGGEILSKMILARSGDIYIAPEQRFMETAKEKKVIYPTTIKNIAYMVPVIAVKKGNPKQIISLTELAKRGIRLAVTRPETTLLGKYAPEIFQKAGLGEAITKNISTYASDPNNLLTMLIMGQIDAGIIWHFYQTLAPDRIETIYLSPEQLTGIGVMQIAVSAYSRDNKLAQQFVNFTTSSEGKAIFKRHGYVVEAEEVKRYLK